MNVLFKIDYTERSHKEKKTGEQQPHEFQSIFLIGTLSRKKNGVLNLDFHQFP